MLSSVVRTACVYALLGITPVYAADYIQNYIPEARMVGQGRAHVLIWDVYEAKLYAPGGVYTENQPFALELEYLQELQGRKIADHAVSEMRRLGYKNEMKLAAWHDRMSSIFPDVIPGSIVTGIYMPGGATVFYNGNTQLGKIDDPAFGKEFFRIWLDVRTSTPALRKELLNIGNKKGTGHESPENSRSFGGGHAS